MASVLPYGSWPSEVTFDRLLAASTRIGEVRVGESAVFWSELRPHEGGRSVVVSRPAGGDPVDVLPSPYSARTRAHEYGGGAWWLHDDALFFANWDDQRLYRVDLDRDGPPLALTPAPASEGCDRYADGVVTPDHRWIVCVREREGPAGADDTRNELVAVSVEPSETGPAEPVVVVSRADFVSSPRVSPDGRLLAWIQWNHPSMPWDGTELWVGRLEGTGPLGHASPVVAGARRVAGGVDESIFQPEWDRRGVLHFVSDRNDWWNLYRFAEPGAPDPTGGGPGSLVEPVVLVDGEIGVPQWVFGLRRYAFLADGRILCAIARDGIDHLAVSDGRGGARRLDAPHTAVAQVQGYGEGAVIVAGSPHDEPAVLAVDLTDEAPAFVRLSTERGAGLDRALVSVPTPVDVPTGDGEVTHALLYLPVNPAASAPPGERPPLLVSIHGGPTSAARAQLDLRTQFWTSRGFAVVDVNYRGSTGYGRRYRQRLSGQWGVVDVEDCVAVARHLADGGLVDRGRLAIHGGSAGGFTTLAALEHHDLFAAGAVFYGVVDLESLAHDTHKFESRYLDGLVGPYPEERDRYVERSPLHRAEDIDVPVLVLQGLEDRVVPPAQTEALVEALRSRGVAHAYLAFEGEQHGFRRAETIRRALEAELAFYAAVFGFVPADRLPALELHGSVDQGRR